MNLVEDKKNTLYYAFIGGIVVFVLGVCWFLLREPDVHDQRERARDVTESLERAGAEQRNAQSDIERVGRELDSGIGRIDEIASGIDDAENSIRESKERRAECAGILEDSESRIRESSRILQTIRERAGQN